MKRMWLTSTLILCGLVQAFVGWNTVQAEDNVAAGEKLLPKNTLLFFSAPSVPEIKAQFEKSLVHSMLNDKEFQPFLESLKGKIDEYSEKLHDEVGVTLNELLALPQGEITFAVLEQPARKISIVLMFDYGDNKETVEKLLKKMHDALDDDSEHSTEEVGDVKIHTYVPKTSDENIPFKLAISYFNDQKYLVFSNDSAALTEVLNRWDGKSDDTLADNPAFKYIQEQCKDESGNPLMVWFFNPTGTISSILSMVQAVNPAAGMAAPFLPMFGVDKLKGIGGAGYGASGDFESVTKSFMYVDTPFMGVINMFQFPATELTPPKWVPADASVYVGANWNVSQAYQAIEGMVDMFQGRGALAKALDQFASNGPGIHVKKDVLDVLDGKWHMLQKIDDSDDDTPGAPLIMFSLDVKDAAKAKKTLSKIAKSENADFETREFNGTTIYELTQGEQTLSFTVAAGQFVVTNDTATLEGMLRSERQPSLADSPAYRKIAKHFPSKMSMVSFQRSDAQLKTLYEMLKNADTEFLEGIDVKKLPDFEVLQKYLRPSGSYTVPNKKGALTIGFELREGDK